MNDYDAKLGIYSRSDFLTEKLETRFKDKYIDVKTFTEIKDVDLKKLNYLIVNLINIQKSNYKSEIQSILELITDTTCKIIILFPQYVLKEEKLEAEKFLEDLVKVNPDLGIILVPEILGPSVKYNKNYISHDIIMQSIVSERIKIKNDGRLINTTSVNSLCEKIVREIFSFGSVGKRLLLIGPRRGAKTFATKYLKIKEEDILLTTGIYDREEISADFSSAISFSLRLAVGNTKKTFSESEILSPVIEPIIKTTKRKKRVLSFPNITKLLILLFITYLIPFILIFVSSLILVVSTRFVFSNNELAVKLANTSGGVAAFSKSVNFGNSFYYNTAGIIQKVSGLMNESFILTKNGSQLGQHVMSNEAYDINFYANNISASLDKIHTDISFLQSDVNELKGISGKLFRNYLISKKVDIGSLKAEIYSFKNLASRLPVLLGVEKPVKYLVLFQNNMELRPTGGFIGSYALLTMDKGRMTEVVVSDVYSADGQLKGHVDPPEPIRKYLDEGGWYLRDSNWDPDFSESAVKAEWFLDKEVGEKVDGVIAIDLNFIQSILKLTGPIILPDFKQTITADNLYQVTQSEVEDEFFPGSIKKASFLTSLSKNLITAIQNLKTENYFLTFREIYNSLIEKHIQIFLHDKNSQEAVSSLDFSGEIDMNTNCQLRCFADRYLLVDANLGVNKANYFLKRSQELNLYVTKEQVGHELLVAYENTAGVVVGAPGVYKSYTRLIVPTEAKVNGVRVYNPDGTFEDLAYDEEIKNARKEIGFLIEIPPSVQKRVQIAWNIQTDVFANGGEYNILVKKQAGTDKDRLKVIIRQLGLTLTGKAPSVYNADLARDFKLKVFFK